jgi:hypothetical protein
MARPRKTKVSAPQPSREEEMRAAPVVRRPRAAPPPPPPPPPGAGAGLWLWIILALVAVLGATGIAYRMAQNHVPAPAPLAVSPTVVVSPTEVTPTAPVSGTLVVSPAEAGIQDSGNGEQAEAVAAERNETAAAPVPARPARARPVPEAAPAPALRVVVREVTPPEQPVRPPLGGGGMLRAAELLYCLDAHEMLAYLEPRLENPAAEARYDRLAEDTQDRCGHYRYRPEEMAAARQAFNELRPEVRAHARRLLERWNDRAPPPFAPHPWGAWSDGRYR